MLLDPVFAPIEAGAPISDAKLQKVVATLAELVNLPPAKKKDVRAWVDGRAKDDNYVTIARKRLVESGLDDKIVQQLPALQAVLLDERREFEVRRDEQSKWLSLPYWKAEAGLVGKSPANDADESLLASAWAVIKVKKAQARLDQKIAMLAHVEALRQYAADHDGNLPAKLEDVDLPLPVDPFTGKAFLYEVSGPTAIIKGSPSKGDEMNPAFNLRYVVTIKK